MKTNSTPPLFTLILLGMFTLSGCGSSSSDSEPATDGSTDSGVTDSGATDSGATDSGATDSGTTDSGTTDSGTTDSGTTDSGTTDSGTTDSGTTDSGTTDSGTTDSGTGGNDTVGLANCPPLTGSGDFSAIAGLYDGSEDVAELGTDVYYVEITTNGVINDYDFLQDEVDQGDNCYIIEKGSSALQATGISTFSITYYDDADFGCETETEEDYLITRANNTLTVDYPDFSDDDDDGDTTERMVETLPVLSGLSVQDFNACE